MKNQKYVISAVIIALSIVGVAMYWYSSLPSSSNIVNPTPAPTISITPKITMTPTPDQRVREYTSTNGYLKLQFTKPMYVREDKDSTKNGWIVASINPIDPNNTQKNGLIINYQSPEIEGKGGACGGENFHKNSVQGQTLELCEGQTSMHGGYLMNKNAKVEYAFFIEAKGVTEYALYRLVLTEGLTFINK